MIYLATTLPIPVSEVLTRALDALGEAYNFESSDKIDATSPITLWQENHNGLGAHLIVASNASNVQTARFFSLPLRLKSVLDALIQARDGVSHTTQIGPWLFRPKERILEKKDSTVVLTEKEAHILAFLVSDETHWASRSTLLSALWGWAEDTQTRTIETHIYALRQKMEDDPSNPQWIITRDGGYALNL